MFVQNNLLDIDGKMVIISARHPLQSSSLLLRTVSLVSLKSAASPLFAREYYKHKEDPLYVPFATDAERELASIRFWVSKNTNLKGVNVNCRVGLSGRILS